MDVPVDDIIDKIEVAGMAAYKAQTERWAVSGDVIFLGMGNSNDLADADMDQWIVEVDGGWRFNKRMDLLFGVRYLRTETTVDFTSPSLPTLEGSTDLVDPVVGIRALGYDVDLETKRDALGLDLTFHGPQLGMTIQL